MRPVDVSVPAPGAAALPDAGGEARRLAALHRLGVLDTGPEPLFESITEAAARVCDAPIALVSLIDAERQWFKSNLGLPGVAQTPRDVAFCDHVIRGRQPLEVGDATADPRFAANPLVTGNPNIRFYAGAPIVLPGGEHVGTVCVIDRTPRRLDAAQRALLESLASIASQALAERVRLISANQALAESEARQRRQYEASPAILHSIDTQGRLLAVSDRWLALLGVDRAQAIGRPSTDFMTSESRRHAREDVLPEFFRTGRVERVAYQMVRSDGERVDVLLSAFLERDADGAPLRSFSVLEDVTARNRIAAELGRTHAHLDTIVDTVPAMLGYWDADGVTRFVNREFQAAVGLPVDRLIGSGLADVCQAVDPTGYALLAPHVAGVLQGRREEFEFSMLTTSGLRQLRATLVPDRSVPGRIAGFHGLWVDITGQKALELRMAQSEARYRSLFEHLNSGFALHEMVVDTDGRPVDYKYLAMNPAFAAMTGLEAGRAIGRGVCELLPGIASDPADWIGVYGRVARTGEPVHFEQRSAALDRWFDVIAYRPAPGQFAVIAQDVTQRRAGAAALALGEQRLQLLVDAVQDHAMVQLDREGRIRTWNAGACRILGHDAAAIVGEPGSRLYVDEDVARGEPGRQLAEAAERGRRVGEGWRRRQDGSRFWAAVTVTALRHAPDGLLGFVVVMQDLTERRRDETLARQVADRSPVATLLVDAGDRVAFVNARAEALFRCPREHLSGAPVDRLLPEGHGRIDPGLPGRAHGRVRRPDGTASEAAWQVTHVETADGPARIVALWEVGAPAAMACPPRPGPLADGV